MKKIFILFMMGLLMISCSDNSEGPLPTDIDPNSITFESKPGSIKFKWSIPDNSNYKFIKVTYTIPDEPKERVRLSSKYSDTLLVDNLLKKYGEINFSFQTYTAEGRGGAIHTVKASALAALQTIKTDKSSIALDKDHVWTDSEQPDDGPLKNLVDGDPATFYHMRWQDATDFPHYIVFDMQKDIRSLQFSYQCRNHGNKDNPKTMNIYGSNQFDGKKFVVNDFDAWKIGTVTNLPATKAATYQSETIVSNKAFRYIWFEITEATSGNWWVALSEFSLFKIKMSTYDPETGKVTVVE